MVEHCPPDWLVRADVLAAVGTAYGEWAAFDKAIPYLQKALETEDMERQASLKVAEQLANFEVRWGKESQQPSLIERGIDRLRKLVALAESGERLALLGSAYKRLAQLRKGKDRQAALEECAAWYERSARHKLARGAVDPYPVLNWLTLEAVLQRAPQDAAAWLARARAAAVERFAVSRSFWDAVSLPDAALLEHLLADSLDAAACGELVRQYLTVFAETHASEKERDSVLRQIAFIEEMTLERTSESAARALPVLRQLRGAAGRKRRQGRSAARRAEERCQSKCGQGQAQQEARASATAATSASPKPIERHGGGMPRMRRTVQP